MAHRHKRVTRARRVTRAALVAAPVALLATGTAVAVGVAAPNGAPAGSAVRSEAPAAAAARPEADVVSRSQSRLARLGAMRGEQYVEQLHAAEQQRLTRRAVRGAHVHLWTTAALNLWTGSGAGARRVGLVDERTRVLATGRRVGDRAELVVDGAARWVTAAYLSQDPPPAPPPDKPSEKPSDKPSADASPTPSPTPSGTSSASPSGQSSSSSTSQPATNGLSTAPCPDDSVESGLTPSAVAVHRAVCHAFPQITTYLGWDPHGEHASGKAIDIMTSDKQLGDRIAAFLKDHAAQLDLYDIIWWDRIWTPVRASEGWRDYGDHGSPTANHMDHVHVSTN